MQLFWEICNTRQFKKTWFNTLLDCIHFLKFFSQPQSPALQQFQRHQQLWWLCVSSHVKCRVRSPLVLVAAGEGCALHLRCSEAGGDPRHGQQPLGWAGAPKAIQQVGFAKSALQSLPGLCCSFAFCFLLLCKSLCGREHFNTWKLFFSWSQKRTALHCRNREGIRLSWWPGDFERALDDVRTFGHS